MLLSYSVVSCIVVLGCLFLDWMRCCVLSTIKRRNFELDSRLFLYMSSLLWVDDSCLGEVLFFSVFFVICYFHQIVMISVIKLRRVVGLADLHGVNVYRLILCIKLWYEYCDVGLVWFCHLDDSILGMDD